jgi:hypothetical protein
MKERNLKDVIRIINATSYNRDAGEFFYIKKLAPRNNIGDRVGYYNDRYAYVKSRGNCYTIAELVWFVETGEFWEDHSNIQIDHIDGDCKNNVFSNLRKVTSSENHKNMPIRRDNKHGVVGVYFEKYTHKYRASINYEGKHIKSRRFNTLDEAKQWRDEHLGKFGYHTNHGQRYSLNKHRKV